MAYQHGVYISEIPTAVTPPASANSVPVVFGTAPVNLSARATMPVNEPVLCHTYAEAVAAFGYSDDWSFTLSEFIRSHFGLYAMSPVVLVNVLDPATHVTSVPAADMDVVSGAVTIAAQGVLKSSVVVKKAGQNPVTYVEGDDYELDFDADGQLVISILPDGDAAGETQLNVAYSKLNPGGVDKNDIIGGIADGKPTGLELLNEVFPRFRMVPGMVLAPGFSHEPEVAAVMVAKAGNINGMFKAIALTDIPADEAYTDAAAWKNNNSYTSERQINGYPKLKLGDKTFHFSSHLAGVLCATDAANGGVPYVSPSNQPFKVDAVVLDDGSPLYLGPDQAAYLNGEGVMTALNFIGGWKAWGNRTGAYPAVTDPKDSFIPVRRMMDWISNNIILTAWQRLDSPITRRLIEAVTDSINIWLNGLAAQGMILGGRVEFLAEENPETDLMDGIVRFHLYVTPPGPARSIEFVVEYDASYLSGLFAA